MENNLLTQTPPLWTHQKEAVAFAEDKDGVLLDMGMGTGKSRSAIQVARECGARLTLILCPLSVIPAWGKQFREFGPDYTVIQVRSKGTIDKRVERAKQRLELAVASGEKAVLVVNYDTILSVKMERFLTFTKWDLLIADECHRMKAPKGRQSKLLARIAARIPKRLGLTGTPMPKDPLDIYAQMRFLSPGLFHPTFFQFRRRYAVMGGFQGKNVVDFQNQEELRATLATVTYQARVEDVLDLPDKQHITVPVTLSPKARRAYDALSRDFCAEVEEGTVTASNALVKILRLLQLTSGVMKLDDELEEGEVIEIDTAKRDALSDMLLDIGDEPIVVFGRFRADIDSTYAAAKKAGLSCGELSGQANDLEQWQEGGLQVLAVQMQSGGVGIDLTRARLCVYLSTGHGLGDYEQSLARTHRPGQTRKVTYYHVVAEETIDPEVYIAHSQKKDVVTAILDNLKKSTEEA